MLLSSSEIRGTLYIYSCSQILPRENSFQYVRREYATAINFPCLITLTPDYKMPCVRRTLPQNRDTAASSQNYTIFSFPYYIIPWYYLKFSKLYIYTSLQWDDLLGTWCSVLHYILYSLYVYCKLQTVHIYFTTMEWFTWYSVLFYSIYCIVCMCTVNSKLYIYTSLQWDDLLGAVFCFTLYIV